jgi:hypothetical protein
MLYRVDSMTARPRRRKQVVTDVMRWVWSFGLVVEQTPLPANGARSKQRPLATASHSGFQALTQLPGNEAAPVLSSLGTTP